MSSHCLVLEKKIIRILKLTNFDEKLTLSLIYDFRTGDKDRLVKEIKGQLKKMAIVDKNRMDEMFLRYDSARLGYIDVTQLGDMCNRLQLPAEPDIMQAVSAALLEPEAAFPNIFRATPSSALPAQPVWRSAWTRDREVPGSKLACAIWFFP